MSSIRLVKDPKRAAAGAELVIAIAPLAFYKKGWLKAILPKVPEAALIEKSAAKAKPGRHGAVFSTLSSAKTCHRLFVAVLPEEVSRHNSPARGEAVAHSMAQAASKLEAKTAVLLGVAQPEHQLPAVAAVGRALPLYRQTSGNKGKKAPSLSVSASLVDGSGLSASSVVKETLESVRWAARMVDTPTAELDTHAFAREIRKLVRGLKVRVTEIKGKDLLEKKLGGIHGVGRCAKTPPRLLVLDYNPTGSKACLGLVGKGIVYDTGGLSLKPTTGMCNMKSDMGGAAAMAGAFRVLAATGFKDRVVCALPIAENAIGPDSYRPDDIVKMHSGHTVEINNTDAEGRLLLGDAVSYLGRRYKPDFIADAATLTGAQLLSTGKRHAAIVSNRDGIEGRAWSVGRASGDLVHPLPFVPEFSETLFRSKIADMKNSVSDRMDAQSSAAAWFVWAQIDDLNLPWLHIDLAGPAFRDGRGTGFGVALVSQLLMALKKKDLRD